MAYSQKQIEELHESLGQVIGDLHSIRERLILDIHPVLNTDEEKTYLLHGVGRRMATIARCAQRIFELFDPGITKPLPLDVNEEIKIHLQAHTINVIGLLDNWAHIFVVRSGKRIRRLDVGLFKKETQAILPCALAAYLDRDHIKTWYDTYAKDYRHALAHRIPLYVPPAEFTPSDQKAYEDADKELWTAIRRGDFKRVEELEETKASIGRPSFVVIHDFVEARPFLLHPQLISDAMTVVELSQNCMSSLV